jgi:hypothetical protein|tara:strand:+ start:373 stop:621 length:249 start_codon:yes stop_codon:yes gene_type:complete
MLYELILVTNLGINPVAVYDNEYECMMGAEDWKEQNIAAGCVPKISPEDAFERLLNIMNEFDQIINDGSAQGIINELPEQVE